MVLVDEVTELTAVQLIKVSRVRIEFLLKRSGLAFRDVTKPLNTEDGKIEMIV